MIHLVKLSGGRASAVTADLVCQAEGPENVRHLFTDTLIEDRDLYRFLIEWLAYLYGGRSVGHLLGLVTALPEVWEDEAGRAAALDVLRERTMLVFPELFWIADGRNPWEVFFQSRMMGSSRLDPCSRALKRELSEQWIAERFTPQDVAIYVGLGYHERHRFYGRGKKLGVRRLALPWDVRSPLVDMADIGGAEMLGWIASAGVVAPRLYGWGMSTNNCGGACVKAGHGFWLRLLQFNRAYYLWWEAKEREFRRMIGKDVSILKDRRGRKSRPLTLEALRRRWERGDDLTEMLVASDHGCGGSCALAA